MSCEVEDGGVKRVGKVSVPSASVLLQQESQGKFVSYDVVVEAAARKWVVHRRFSDFLALDTTLSRLYPGRVRPQLPSKRWLGNFRESVVDRRRLELEEYLVGVVNDEAFSQVDAVIDFLGARTLQMESRLDSFGYVMRSGRYLGPKRKLSTRVSDMDVDHTPCGPKCCIM